MAASSRAAFTESVKCVKCLYITTHATIDQIQTHKSFLGCCVPHRKCSLLLRSTLFLFCKCTHFGLFNLSTIFLRVTIAL